MGPSSSTASLPIATQSTGSFDIMPVAKIRGVANWGKQQGVPLYRTTEARIEEMARGVERNLDGA